MRPGCVVVRLLFRGWVPWRGDRRIEAKNRGVLVVEDRELLVDI